MVLNGANPIEAMCILNKYNSHPNAVCVILATKNKEE